MNDLKIQQVWNYSYAEFSEHHIQSQEQLKTSHAIRNCKTGMLGATISQCTDCGHIEYHNNSCRNRNCPNCQSVKKELWVFTLYNVVFLVILALVAWKIL